MELGLTHAGLRAAVRSAWAGLGAGFLHTLSGPDHLAVNPKPAHNINFFEVLTLAQMHGMLHEPVHWVMK